MLFKGTSLFAGTICSLIFDFTLLIRLLNVASHYQSSDRLEKSRRHSDWIAMHDSAHLNSPPNAQKSSPFHSHNVAQLEV